MSNMTEIVMHENEDIHPDHRGWNAFVFTMIFGYVIIYILGLIIRSI